VDKQLDREVLDFIAMQPGDKTHRMLVERGWTPPATDAPEPWALNVPDLLLLAEWLEAWNRPSRSFEWFIHNADMLRGIAKSLATPPAGGGAIRSLSVTDAMGVAALGARVPGTDYYVRDFILALPPPTTQQIVAVAALTAGLAESAGGARVGQEAPDALDADELELFRQTVADFEDCEETSTDHDTLMRWAEMGLLECERFEVTKKGYALAAPTPETPYVDTRAARG
jgi:hypothetical protein